MTAQVLTGRWQDVLAGAYDPERAVVITDPPYGLDVDGGIYRRAPGGHPGRPRPGEFHKGYDDSIRWADHVAGVLAQLPARRHVIRGPAPVIIRRDHPQPRRLCIEVAPARRDMRAGVVPYQWQAWAVYGSIRIGPRPAAPSGDTLTLPEPQRTDPSTRHGARTPLEAARWVVRLWAEEGDVVVDPFAGVGTIGIAARELGFEYLGAEIIAEYAGRARAALGVEAPTLGLAV